MRVAYVVAAHRNLEQLERLLRRLADGESVFVVHVDRRAGRRPFEELRERTSDLSEVRYVDRHLGHWGGFGVVRAALKCMRVLVRDAVDFDYAALLSGQDYPLRPPRAISETLSAAEGRSYMTYIRLPHWDWGPRGGFDRIEDWHLVSHLALHVGLPWKRRIPGGLTPYGGDTWWCWTRPVVEYVDGFARSNPRFLRFFEHVLHPSELFFQTVVMNSPLADSVVNESLRCVEWRGGPNPATWTAAEFDRLVGSGKLFARKFDVAVDAEILDLLDAHIDSEVATAAR